MKTAALVVGLAIAGSWANGALAESLAICGASQGNAYYFQGGLVDRKNSGWTTDGISKGSTTLSRDSKGAYDIVFSDAIGGSYSVVGEGGAVAKIRLAADEAAFVVLHGAGDTIEVFQFVRTATGSAEMALLQSKATPAIRKAALYVAKCDYLSLK